MALMVPTLEALDTDGAAGAHLASPTPAAPVNDSTPTLTPLVHKHTPEGQPDLK
jgi:hypothetical protein